MAERQSDEMSGKITGDGINRFRARIGILAPRPRPFNTVANEDAIRHFAWSYGEDNPLWNDPEYAAKTRWRSLIAPPPFVNTMGVNKAKPIPKEIRDRGAGALRGVPNYNSGNAWEFYQPVYPGDTMTKRFYISDVEEKRSEFGGGKAVVVHHKYEFVNQRDELVAVLMNYFFHVEREASEKTGKYKTIEPPEYDDEYLAKIDEAYANETIRGAEPRYWEDVNEDDKIPTIVRGPLTVTDVICGHIGMGGGAFGVSPLKLAYKNRMRIPAFYTRNEYSAWDVAQRVHWDSLRAQRVGNPRAYDYGRMRSQWMTNLVTNWMGDDAYLFETSEQIRKFNYMGDTSWIHGKVSRKYTNGPHCLVDLETWIENQRGEVTAPGQATVILPSSEKGPVVLPSETGQHKPAVQDTEYSVIVEPRRSK